MAINSWVSTFAELTARLPQLVVEKYQRPYSWGDDQIQRLFEEHFYPLVDGTDLSHMGDPFVGTVVVMPAGDNAFEIIDGQQRCSTMTMIYAEAYRSLREKGGTFANGPAARFLATDNGGAWIRMKSQDHDIYRVLVAPAGSRLDIDEYYDKAISIILDAKGPKGLGAITRVRNIIVKHIEEYVEIAGKESRIGRNEALLKLLKAIRDSLKVVAVSVDGHGQGLAVFESLNTVGLPLTLEQLIRNCLMKAFNDPKSHGIIDLYWDGSGSVGRSLYDAIPRPEHRTDFLMQYYQAFHGPINATNAYNQFKRLANEVKEGRHHKGLTQWLMHMQLAWKFYATYKGPLKSLGGKAVYPLLLLTNQLDWQDESVCGEAIDRVAFALEAALLRTQVCSGKITTLTNASVSLCEIIRKGGYGQKNPRELEDFLRTRFARVTPDDAAFALAIENSPVKHSSRRVEMMLRRINYAERVGLRDIHRNITMDEAYDGDIVHATTPKDNPRSRELASLGLDDFGEYNRLTRSLANVILQPKSGAAARVPVNMGLSTNSVDSKILKQRSRALARAACRVWKLKD